MDGRRAARPHVARLAGPRHLHRIAQRHDRPAGDTCHRDRLCTRAGHCGPAPHRRCGTDDGHGRLQRRPQWAAQPHHRLSAGHRAQRGHHAGHRPRSAAGGVPPGEPAAAHRPPAADRLAVALTGLPQRGDGSPMASPAGRAGRG